MDIKFGSQDVAPNTSKEGLDCLVNTMPVTKPVSVINGRIYTYEKALIHYLTKMERRFKYFLKNNATNWYAL